MTDTTDPKNASAIFEPTPPIASAPPKRGFFERLFGKKTPRAPRPFQPLSPDFAVPGLPSMKDFSLYDMEESQRKSLMYKQKPLCNGAASNNHNPSTGRGDGTPGKQCVHYMTLVKIASSANATALLDGERFRMCKNVGAEPDVFNEGKEGMAVQCTGFLADERRDYNPDDDADKYQPLTPDEIERIDSEEIKTRDELEEYRKIYPPGEYDLRQAAKKSAEKTAGDAASTVQKPVQTVTIADALKEK